MFDFWCSGLFGVFCTITTTSTNNQNNKSGPSDKIHNKRAAEHKAASTALLDAQRGLAEAHQTAIIIIMNHHQPPSLSSSSSSSSSPRVRCRRDDGEYDDNDGCRQAHQALAAAAAAAHQAPALAAKPASGLR